MMLRRIQIAVSVVLFAIFFVFALLIVKPIASAFIAGILLAVATYPLYKFLVKYLKYKTLVAFLICVVLLVVIGVGTWYGAKQMAAQAASFYKEMRKYDVPEKIAKFVTGIILPKETSQDLADTIELKIKNGVKTFSNSLSTGVDKFLSNIVMFVLQLFVAFFVMFYFLRDGEEIYKGIYEILPFDEKTKKLFEKRSEEVTKGVIVGRIVLGIIQGIVCGIGFWIFGVKQPILFGVLATFFAIIPFIGPWFVWIPVGINLFIISGVKVGILHMLFQFIVTSHIDNLLSPIIIGKTARMHNLNVLIGMIGGLLAFGIVGFFIGPLIIEYVFLFLEIFKEEVERLKKEREERERKEGEKEKEKRG
jgi:predicted PurR-regulated permease PerM